ncbi:Aste57867_21340 [Aphanomyces stellatus]|uniref:Aste57867_21340 protein n=1 Tax=Aphanomyces stellatus TaxID=120398 RepID=A0A485LHW1_9STRA|nr:hypothetical protein As57867_021271 [Aphanomyces stellatus]VFT98012.1 Aste57867_21340 [Aphanomyces stellatus]
MKATKLLKRYFDANPPVEEQIHVLVVVPEGAVASEISETAQMIKKVDEMHAQIVQTKREQYVHSKVGSSDGKKLLQALNIQVDAVDAVPFATRNSTPVQAFRWASVSDERGQEITLTEEQQRQRYRSYVEDNIGDVLAEKKLCVLGVEKGGNILSVAVPGYDIDLVGRTDILVLSDIAKKHPLHLQFLPGVRLLIEVKKTKDLKSGCVYQALSELIALDLLTKDPMMALLTDLNGHWQFFWVSERTGSSTIIQTLIITTPGEAFQVIRTLLAQSPSSDEDIHLPCYEGPVKRRKLAKMLPSITEGGACGDIHASLQRMYDIASMLGPDIDMARDVARQITRSIPSFSMYT